MTFIFFISICNSLGIEFSKTSLTKCTQIRRIIVRWVAVKMGNRKHDWIPAVTLSDTQSVRNAAKLAAIVGAFKNKFANLFKFGWLKMLII